MLILFLIWGYPRRVPSKVRNVPTSTRTYEVVPTWTPTPLPTSTPDPNATPTSTRTSTPTRTPRPTRTPTPKSSPYSSSSSRSTPKPKSSRSKYHRETNPFSNDKPLNSLVRAKALKKTLVITNFVFEEVYVMFPGEEFMGECVFGNPGSTSAMVGIGRNGVVGTTFLNEDGEENFVMSSSIPTCSLRERKYYGTKLGHENYR